MNTLVQITIPVYKIQPDKYELISFNQCIKLLGSYDFSSVCPENFDASYYKDLFDSNHIAYTIQRFDNEYFKDLNTYSALMLSSQFYNRFKEYEYLLIYQLDAYVFRDELPYWCGLGYDYIGAPWIEKSGTVIKLATVGNGGLSLRHTQAFISRLSYRYPLKSPQRIWKEFNVFNRYSRILHLPVILMKIFGYKNTMSYFVKHTIYLEDVFWCVFLNDSKFPLEIPDAKLASLFCVEKGIRQLYAENDNKLPFACHAWRKYDYDFWKGYIQ
jgi:hypothetical protein